jgi:hypothetical protein
MSSNELQSFSTVSISLSTFQFCAHQALSTFTCSRHLFTTPDFTTSPGSNIPSYRASYNLHTFRSAGPSTHAFITSFHQRRPLSSIHHHRTSSPHIVSDDGKRAHAFHSIYIVLHSANIVIQYIGWGFHIGSVWVSYIFGMYQYHHLQGCRQQDTSFFRLLNGQCAYLCLSIYY